MMIDGEIASLYVETPGCHKPSHLITNHDYGFYEISFQTEVYPMP
jgi:hypothetical protein